MKTTSFRNILLARPSPGALTPSRFHAPLAGLHVLLALAISALASAAFAQTWQTVDDFQYVAGQPAANRGLTVASSGTLFAAGYADDLSGPTHGLVMSSADGGNTWSGALDDFVYAPDYITRYDGGIIADSAGKLYVAGRGYASGAPTHLIVRRSNDGGAPWSTVDDFAPGGTSSQAHGITADAAGNVFVASAAVSANNVFTWTIRKGIGGTSFSTVDSYPSGSRSGFGSTAFAVFAHPTAGIFAAGYGNIIVKNSISQAWLVRRSLDVGATWSTVDTFQLQSSQQARALGIGADTLGNLYVAGRGNLVSKGTSYGHWLVRKSSNGGNSWTTIDDFQSSATGSSEARQFVADSHGNLFVAGEASTITGTGGIWIVRENLGGTGGWSSVDAFQYVAGYESEAHAIAANASGNVFVGGLGDEASGSFHWLIRRK